MRIEVDTKQDSREELAALADMLQRLSRSSASGAVIPKPASRNIFDDPSPGVGLMGMFGDTSSASAQPQLVSQSSSYSSPAPAAEPQPTSGLFSIFGDSTAQVAQASSSQYSQSAYAQPVSSEPERKTTAQDILDDDRIQLY